MTLTKDKPVFHIIENPVFEIDMEMFEKDYLNPHFPVAELKRKYDLGYTQYTRLAKQVREKHGIIKKPTSYMSYNKMIMLGYDEDMRHIRNTRGVFRITKNIDGVEYHIGRFDDLDTCRRVRDYLVACNWDLDEISRVRDKYPLRKPKDALIRAKEIYPRWKELYLHSPLGIKEVNKSLDVHNGVYGYLLNMIREEYGIYFRPCKEVRVK